MNLSEITIANHFLFPEYSKKSENLTDFISAASQIRQDQHLANYLRDKEETISIDEIDIFCKNQKIEIKNCGSFSLRQALVKKNEALVDQIMQATKELLNTSLAGFTPLLSVIVEGAKAYPLVARLISAGANVNCALHKNAKESFFEKKIPCHATPLYIATEITQHIPTIHLLRESRAICYPPPSAEGKKLIDKVNWLFTSGKFFYTATYTAGSFFIENRVPQEIKNIIFYFTMR